MPKKIVIAVVSLVALAWIISEVLQRSNQGSVKQSSGATASANLVMNGNFDKNVDSWRTNSNWPAVWSSAEGNGSAKVAAISQGASTGRGVLSQCVNFTGNQRFELSGSFKKDKQSTQEGGGRLRLSWHEENNCFGGVQIDSNWASPDDQPGWQQLRTGVLKRPANAQSAKIEIIQSIDGSGEFIAYWDNVYLNPLP